MVSLVVPVYNGCRYIATFYDQFRKQTYRDTELIFVDDGSVDQSADVIRRIIKKDNRVRLIIKEQGGPASARNQGKVEALGEYIVFADIDDYILPTYIEYLVSLIRSESADMAVCRTLKITERGLNKIDRYNVGHDEKNILDNRTAIYDFCYRRFIFGYPFSKIIRKDLADTVDFPEELLEGEDFVFVYNLLKKCNKTVYGNQIQYLYVQRPTSISHQRKNTKEKYYAQWRSHMNIISDVKKNYPEAENGIITKCYLIAIMNTYRIPYLKADDTIKKEALLFIRENAVKVFHDTKGSLVTRMLGVAGMISPHMMSLACRSFAWIFIHFGITLKKGL